MLIFYRVLTERIDQFMFLNNIGAFCFVFAISTMQEINESFFIRIAFHNFGYILCFLTAETLIQFLNEYTNRTHS